MDKPSYRVARMHLLNTHRYNRCAHVPVVDFYSLSKQFLMNAYTTEQRTDGRTKRLTHLLIEMRGTSIELQGASKKLRSSGWSWFKGLIKIYDARPTGTI